MKRVLLPNQSALIALIEKLVKEYDILVAFHNHPRQPSNPAYRMWDPNYILYRVRERLKATGSAKLYALV